MEVKIEEVVRNMEMITQENLCYYDCRNDEYLWNIDERGYAGEVIPLPNKKEINDYHIMQNFIEQKADAEARGWLRNAIVGSGAFRRFRVTCERFGILNDWYEFQRYAYEAIAMEWCEENGLEYDFSPVEELFDDDDEDEYVDEEEEEEEVYTPHTQRSFVRVVDINEKNAYALGYMVTEFRKELSYLRDAQKAVELEEAKEEINSYLKKQYPIFAVSENGKYLGYAVCKVEDDVVFLESLFVRKEERRKGYGKMLLERCEEVAKELGNETLYLSVHPNNEVMLRFLKENGYDVLNLLELRKAYKKEKLSEEYSVGNHKYRY